MDILAIEFHPSNFFVISQKIDNINRIIETLSSTRSVGEWREYWRLKITEIVELIWKQAMLKGISIPMNVNTSFSNGICVYNPELNEVKEKYLREVKSFVGWPCESKFLNGADILQK